MNDSTMRSHRVFAGCQMAARAIAMEGGLDPDLYGHTLMVPAARSVAAFYRACGNPEHAAVLEELADVWTEQVTA
jgi:hypothetical protein